MNCHSCGAPLAATARFCHKCGAQVGGTHTSGWRAGLPWGVAGAAVGALITLIALRTAPRSRLPAPSMLGPPDISQMSPEERATRLYNRVLTLHSEGKADSAGFFLPMALQAYAMLPALDVDARYHIGVLDLTGGDETGALAQADSINHAVPNHLFASMLRARALELRRDAPGARQAYDNLLRHEAAARARKRPEYAAHETNRNTFHEQAIRATAGNPRRGR